MIIFKSHNELFSVVKKYIPENPIIVEAGAFTGHDTVKMAELWPQSRIYAFEPVPEIYEKLVEHVAAKNNVYCYKVALGDQNGNADLYVAHKKSGVITQASSLHKPQGRLSWSSIFFPYTIFVPTITLDTWAMEEKIERVDFLWLDLQGHELSVMRAAPKIMKTVRALWIEVAFAHNYEHQPLYEEVLQWLEGQGFVLMGQNFVPEKNWFFGSILCIRK